MVIIIIIITRDIIMAVPRPRQQLGMDRRRRWVVIIMSRLRLHHRSSSIGSSIGRGELLVGLVRVLR
jgi:hypothetical protein